ncbi:hypothetical protein J6590_049969 [Homalodisca vitripennis]|nr:hypothetical protein J6590_049969 [Homalodisca vitripennis]
MMFSRNTLTVFGIHLEIVVGLKPVSNTIRILMAVFMFYCMIMSVAYKASLESVLMAPLTGATIQTWEQLEQSNLKITGGHLSFTVLNEISKDHCTLQEILKRFKIHTPTELSTLFHRIQEKRDTAYFGAEGGANLITHMNGRDGISAEPTICKINEAVTSSPLSLILTRRGSIFTLLFNRVVVKYMQAGLLAQNRSVFIKKTAPRRINNKPKPYILKQFRYIFLLWLCGMITASLIFLLEKLNSMLHFDKGIVF